MSNVIKMDINYFGPDQAGVIGKVYEEFYTDNAGNLTSRSYRMIKAAGAITAGALVGGTAATSVKVYTEGLVEAIGAVGVSQHLCYGVSVSTLATNEYGFVVCKGVVDGVKAAAGITVGELLKSDANAGRVEGFVLGAGTSNAVIGVALTATAASTITAYIDLD